MVVLVVGRSDVEVLVEGSPDWWRCRSLRLLMVLVLVVLVLVLRMRGGRWGRMCDV